MRVQGGPTDFRPMTSADLSPEVAEPSREQTEARAAATAAAQTEAAPVGSGPLEQDAALQPVRDEISARAPYPAASAARSSNNERLHRLQVLVNICNVSHYVRLGFHACGA